MAPMDSILGLARSDKYLSIRFSSAHDKKVGYKMINIRSERRLEKRSFKRLLIKSKRCRVLADSYFEWKKDGKKKQPFRIYLPNREMFFFAGLWSSWKDPEREPYNTFSIITTTPNALMEKIHDRIPVIFSSEGEKPWLDLYQNPKDLLNLLNIFPADGMEAYRSSQSSPLAQRERKSG